MAIVVAKLRQMPSELPTALVIVGRDLSISDDALADVVRQLRQRATELGIPARSYAHMLGELSASRSTIAVAGTHGKSTVTAMVAEILIQAGRDPISRDFGRHLYP